MVILTRLRSMRGSGAAVLATVWSTNSSTTTWFFDADFTAESITTPRAVALLSTSSWRSCALDCEYMSLNSPVAPLSTSVKFWSTLLESMLVSTWA